MPMFDQTGPAGKGAMTGRRQGKCITFSRLVTHWHPMPGRGMKYRRGSGWSRGRGFQSGRGDELGFSANRDQANKKDALLTEINELKKAFKDTQQLLNTLQRD